MKEYNSPKIVFSFFSILNFNRFKKKKKTIIFADGENSYNKHIYTRNQKQLFLKCPSCQQIFDIKKKIFSDNIIKCPNCGRIGSIQSKEKKQNIFSKITSKIFTKNSDMLTAQKEIFKVNIGLNLIGIITVLIGLSSLIAPSLFSIKISITFIIIGVSILILIPNNGFYYIKSNNKKNIINHEDVLTPQNIPETKDIDTFLRRHFDLPRIITIVFILWIGFFYLITGDNNIDIFIIFIYLGILMIKVFTNELLTLHLKQRMNILVVAFLLVFIIIVIKRIISIVRI